MRTGRHDLLERRAWRAPRRLRRAVRGRTLRQTGSSLRASSRLLSLQPGDIGDGVTSTGGRVVAFRVPEPKPTDAALVLALAALRTAAAAIAAELAAREGRAERRKRRRTG
jgi:hypothetical protein